MGFEGVHISRTCFPDDLINSTSAKSEIVCMYVCVQNSLCLSFSYNDMSFACKLYDVVYGNERTMQEPGIIILEKMVSLTFSMAMRR